MIIIGLNEAANLPDGIRSAREACERAEAAMGVATRIVYVDSGSSDNSRQIARAEGAEVFLANPNFRGPGNGRASGFLLTEQPYVMFLDGDCALHPDWLVEGARFLRAHPDAGAVAGSVDYIRHIGGRTIRQANFDRVSRAEPVRNLYTGMGTLLARREAVEQFGGHEPDLRRSQDVYFICQLQKHGREVYRIPAPMMAHANRHMQTAGAGLSKLRHYVTTSVLRGALLRQALAEGIGGLALRYYRWEIMHAAVLFALVAIAALALRAEAARMATIVAGAAIALAYSGILVRRRRNFIFGLSLVPVLTINLCGGLLGFVTNKPVLRWGAQRAPAYRTALLAANAIQSGPSVQQSPESYPG